MNIATCSDHCAGKITLNTFNKDVNQNQTNQIGALWGNPQDGISSGKGTSKHVIGSGDLFGL